MENYSIRKRNIIKIMYIYWIAIIVWQYIRPVANRSIIDSLVKIGGFSLILLYMLRHGRNKINKKMGCCLVIFFLSQLLTIIFDSGTLSISNLITIIFMFVEIVCFLVFLSKEVIYISELEQFCKYLLITGMIMAVYNVIFHSNRFFTVFTSGSAYGMECKSFLYSNHEYGIYLSAAILSSLWLTLRNKLNKFIFIVCALFMFINLLSTYSRTAIIGCLVAILVLLFFNRKIIFVECTIFFSAVLIYVYNNPILFNIVFNKIMKESFVEGQVLDAGRSSMYAEELQSFLNGNFIQKLFGYGYAGKEMFSGHDAYLSILLTGGIFMFMAFIGIIILGIYYSMKCIKVKSTLGSLLLAYQIFSLLYMVAQTPILFYSSLDCFFLTMITIMIPKYVFNHINDIEEEKRNENIAD